MSARYELYLKQKAYKEDASKKEIDNILDNFIENIITCAKLDISQNEIIQYMIWKNN